MDAGTNGIIEMPCPFCTLDCPHGNDPVQPLRYRVPEFLKKPELKILITISLTDYASLQNPVA